VSEIHITQREETSLLTFVVGASLQKSKLHKAMAESKSLLACHLLRLL
jgi:hypothetical protein